MSIRPKAPNEPPPTWLDWLIAIAVIVFTALFFGVMLRSLLAFEIKVAEAILRWLS